jgi:hypothetical protein
MPGINSRHQQQLQRRKKGPLERNQLTFLAKAVGQDSWLAKYFT